jgi:hypothetical protein
MTLASRYRRCFEPAQHSDVLPIDTYLFTSYPSSGSADTLPSKREM